MLALMPPSPPLRNFYTPNIGTSPMSLTLLPSSPMTYTQQAVSTLLPSGPSPVKRPKLSLNTSNVNAVYGKGSTSLRLETLSATSPTAKNTFRNGQNRDRKVGARPDRPAITPLSTDVAPMSASKSISSPSSIPLPASAEGMDSSSSSAASTNSISTIGSLLTEVPYKLPFNASSILMNGPIPRTRSRTTSSAQSRPMFAVAKRVAFRAPLTENIQTTMYTLRHSDIESTSIPSSPLKLSVRTDGDERTSEDDNLDQSMSCKSNAERKVTGSPLAGCKRESEDEEEDSDSDPQTPVAGRRKRHRHWVWTLGPIPTNAKARGADDEEKGA